MLEFLSYAFHGGTSLDEVIEASVQRLQLAQWENADLLVVTDGAVPRVSEQVLEHLEAAKERGCAVYGVVVGGHRGGVMQELCSELYHFVRREGRQEASLGTGWALRPAALAGGRRPNKRGALVARRATREQRWAAREEARRTEHEKAVKARRWANKGPREGL